MSLGHYRVIHGNLVVRGGHSPDGDSMRFIADDMNLFEDLPRYSPPTTSAMGEDSYQLRFQAIDTPELHYKPAEQPHGKESRDGLLEWLGENPTSWDWKIAPKGFEWEKPATILCDGFEGHGRPIAFVFPRLELNDGDDIKLTKELLEQSYNFFATETGLAYLGMYQGSVTPQIRQALIAAYQSAKQTKKGIWQLDQTKRFKVETLADLEPPEGILIYPKIFRRCVDALRWADGGFEPGKDIDDFLAAEPREDDKLIVGVNTGGQLRSRLSDVLEQVNNEIRIQVDLNTVEFVGK